MAFAPPQWTKTTGMEPSFFEQGVLHPEGVYPTSGGGQQQMKMVGFAPTAGWDQGYSPGDPSRLGMQMSQGGGPMFEGKHGLMQCGINPSTGEYMKDASGQARCWYVPVIAGSGFSRGGGGTWVNPDRDIIHAAAGAVKHYASGLKVMMGGSIGLIPLALFIAFFAWRVGLNKKLMRGEQPGLLAKIFHWDLWKIWGIKYNSE